MKGMSMKISAIILISCLMLLMTGCMVSGENISIPDNQTTHNVTNETPLANISPEEEIMNLVFEAREYALEAGKEKAIVEFSNPAGRFTRNGSCITAYGMDGTLLADPERKTDIGTLYIADDYDSGVVRLMRDLAASGGGLYTDPTTKDFYYVSEIDGSWWICAGRIKNNSQ